MERGLGYANQRPTRQFPRGHQPWAFKAGNDMGVIPGGYLLRTSSSTPTVAMASLTGRYWYTNGFNPVAIKALLAATLIGLVFTFVPWFKPIANFA